MATLLHICKVMEFVVYKVRINKSVFLNNYRKIPSLEAMTMKKKVSYSLDSGGYSLDMLLVNIPRVKK